MRTREEQDKLIKDYKDSVEIVKIACENNQDLSNLFISFFGGRINADVSRYCNFDRNNKSAFFVMMQLRDNPAWNEAGLYEIRDVIKNKWSV